MPFVCLSTGGLIGIALASVLRLLLEFLFLALWPKDRRTRQATEG